MSKSSPRPRSKPPRTRRNELPRRTTGESPAADAVTVAWIVAVTTALLCDVGAVGGYLLSLNRPGHRGPAMFRDLLLLAGAVAGVAALALLPVVYRVRRVAPPAGLAAFGLCVAVAPVLALMVRLLR